MPHCAVLGDPIAHSLSPVLHRAGYEVLGLEQWTYEAHRVPAGGLAQFVAGSGEEWRGLSLTMPLKREAIALATAATDRAVLAGAANTLVRQDDGWHADNTDLPGASAAIRERYDGPLHSAVILGGGATATSTGLALVDLGVRELHLAVRDAGRAEQTIRALRGHPAGPDVVVETLEGDHVWQADVVVSTVPASAQSIALLARCADVAVVFDVLYDPWPTPLAASATNRVVVGGLDLLIHQAALQFQQFTGQEAPLDAMRAAGQTVLAARSKR